MNVKKIKRKCMVRGCRNTDTFSISNTREMGNTVIICHDCISAALSATKEYTPTVKSTLESEPPVLFYSTIANETVIDDKDKFICENCNKECASKAGLISHKKNCKGGEKNED